MNDVTDTEKILYGKRSEAKEQLWEIFNFMGGITEGRFDWDIADKTGVDLWNIAGKKKPKKPWSGNYVISVLKSQVDPGLVFIEAIDRLNKVLLKGENTVEIKLSKAWVQAPEGTPEGAMIFVDARQCIKPGCKAWFFPKSWNHKYHVKECYLDHKEMKRSFN